MSACSCLTKKQLLTRYATRDIGAELVMSVRQLKAGQGKVVARVDGEPILKSSPVASQSRHAPV